MRNLIAVVMVVGGLLLLAIGGSLEAEEPLELNLFKNGAAQEATREPVIETYGTIHSAGVYVLNAPDADLLHEEVSATLRYRQEGQTEWREGLPLVKLYGGRFAGSIFHLEPATTYEVQAVLKDENDIEIKTLAGTVKTRSNEVVYGKGRTLRVGKNEEFKSIQAAVKEAGPGDMVLITAGTYYESIEEWPRSGKPGAPIVIRGEKGAVLDSADPKFVETGKGYWKPLSQIPDSSEAKGASPEQLLGVYWAEAEYGNPPTTLCTDKGRIYMRKPEDKGHVAQRSYTRKPQDGEGSWRYDREEKRLYVRLPGAADPNKEPIYAARYGIGISIRNRDYLILENLRIQHYGVWDGWMRHCIYMVNCSHCVIQHCAILNGADCQIRIKVMGGEASDNLIQHCYISDPRGSREHLWDPTTSHGNRREGMGLSISGTRGNVIRYNRFGDDLSSCSDNLRVTWGGKDTNLDTDIYENYLEGAEHVINIESCACCNVRIWGNIVVRAGCAHLVAPMGGPLYIFRNVYKDWSACAVTGGEGKWSHPGPLFIYHNTFVNTQTAGITDGELGDKYVNNICWGPGIKDPKMSANNFFGDPGLVDLSKLDFRLKEGSPAIDKAVRLSNINDHFAGKAPDMGAFEFGSDWTGRTLKEELKDDPR